MYSAYIIASYLATFVPLAALVAVSFVGLIRARRALDMMAGEAD